MTKNMNKYYKLLYITITSVLLLPFFISCSSDEDEGNEWTDTIVYLQRNDYLIQDKVFNLTHSSSGIKGDVEMIFTVKTQRPTNEDIIVNLEVTVSEGLNSEDILLSIPQVKIKAKQSQSEEISVSITDFESLKDIEDPVSLTFIVSIKEIKTNDKRARISEPLSSISATINKTAIMNLMMGIPVDSKLIPNRSDWTIVLEEGTENPASNLIDGNRYSDVARNNVGFWLTINMGSIKHITGIKTGHWSAGYAPTEVETQWSVDGSVWKSLGTIKTSGGTQNITFLSEVNAQYIKYIILGMPSSNRVDITEFNIYESSIVQPK